MSQPTGSQSPTSSVPSPVIALAGWVLPGAGYWLIGERARGMVAGVTILLLFIVGTLIGGVRAIQVPGYGEDGGRLYLKSERVGNSRIVRLAEFRPDDDPAGKAWVVAEPRALLGDVGNKPWSICQILNGPIAIAGGALSVQASRVPLAAPEGAAAPGVLSHSRINEIGVLYTAVAGLLNLIVIIDAASRAGRPTNAPADTPSTAPAGQGAE